MRAFALLIVLFPLAAHAAPAASRTLVQCGNNSVQFTGVAPHFKAGNPAKNTDSPRDQWAIVDGTYGNAVGLYFRAADGKRYDVKIHREMAFQYHRYIIEADVIDVPGYAPLGDLGSPVQITITHDPVEGNSADIMGFGDEMDPSCKIVVLP